MDLFENSPDMYHLVNRVGTIVSSNRTEADLLGYRKEDLVGHSILKLYPLDYHDQAKRLLEQIFEQGRGGQGLEQQMVDSKGELLDVSLNTSIIYDDQGQPILMRAVARDITEKKKLEAKILHAQRINGTGLRTLLRLRQNGERPLRASCSHLPAKDQSSSNPS